MNKSPHVEIERNASGYWFWHFRSSNGKILSRSSEGYNDPRDLVRGLELSHPGYDMLDELLTLEGVGGWYLWSPDTGLLPVIPVRVPAGTVKLWRSRRQR